MADFSGSKSTSLQKENIVVIVLTGGEKWKKRYNKHKQTEKYAAFKSISVCFNRKTTKV